MASHLCRASIRCLKRQAQEVSVDGMQIVHDFVSGVLAVIKVTAAPMLYRYPYRTSAEALRGDWAKIGGDLESMMGRLQEELAHER